MEFPYNKYGNAHCKILGDTGRIFDVMMKFVHKGY